MRLCGLRRPGGPACALALLLIGCGRGGPPATTVPAEPAAQSGAKISAEPNPLPAGKGPGKTTISWDSGDGSFVQIYISIDGGEDIKMFAQGAKGSSDADWIYPGRTYEFRLYQGKEHSKLLTKVAVNRPRG